MEVVPLRHRYNLRPEKVPMHLPRFRKLIFATKLMLVSVFIFSASTVLGATMTSTNFIVEQDAITSGGSYGTSTNYAATDSIGEAVTGEGLTSTNYAACIGFQCPQNDAPFITFTLTQGLTSGGASPGAGVALGTLTTSSVTTSDNSSVNSVFIGIETNAVGGGAVTVRGTGGLKRASDSGVVLGSTSGALSAGNEGYGVCVTSTSQGTGSPTSLAKSSPYNGTCDTTTGNTVGVVNGVARTVISSSGVVTDGAAEVLVKASVSAATGEGDDYVDTLTFIATGTF